MNTERSRGYGAVLLSTVLYGLFGVLVKLIGSSLPVFYLTSFRNLTIIGALLIIAHISHTPLTRPEGRDLRVIILRGIVGITSLVITVVSFARLPLSAAYLAFFLGILAGGFVVGSLLQHEKLTSTKVVSLVFAVFGMVLAYGIGSFSASEYVYISLILFSGMLTSTWNILTNHVSKRHSPLTLSVYDFVVGTCVTVLVSLALQEEWTMPLMSTPWIASSLLAGMFVCTGLLIPYGFRRVEAHVGTIISQFEIVFGILFGVILLHEAVTIRIIIGGLCIIIAGALPYAKELRDSMHTRMRSRRSHRHQRP